MHKPNAPIGVDAAIRRIRQECTQVDNDQSWSPPFFFLVGAGISSPTVPLAAELAEECRKRAHKAGIIDPPTDDSPLGAYSHWFASAFPGAAQRRAFLRSKIHDKQITEANLRLAYVLISRRIATIAVTTNFDDFLSRALTLFGEQPIVCDHPDTSARIDEESPELQIAHVHGTYRFYDSCNLVYEVHQRSADEPTRVGMAAMLDNLLREHAPLVMGYSGWVGDVVMTALQRRLTLGGHQPLPQNIYWFCYRESEPEELRARAPWLTDHPNVFFVVPKPEDVGGAHEALASEYLPAQKVLGKMIRAFELPAPKLITDPLEFFVNRIERSVTSANLPESDEVYGLKRAIEEIRMAQAARIRLQDQNKSDVAAHHLQMAREALWRLDHADALDVLVHLDVARVPERNLWDVVHMANAAIDGALEHAESAVGACDVVIAALQRLEQADPQSVQDDLAIAKVRLARIHAAMGNHAHALAIYDQALPHLVDATGPKVRTFKLEALLGKATSLVHTGRMVDALGPVREILRRYVTSDEPELQRAIARAMFLNATILQALQDPEKALAAYDELLTTFRSAYDEVVRQMVLVAAANRGGLLARAGRYAEARESLSLATSTLVFPNARQATVVRAAAVTQALCEAVLGDPEHHAAATLGDAFAHSNDPWLVVELLRAEGKYVITPAARAAVTRLLTVAEARAEKIAAALEQASNRPPGGEGTVAATEAAPN